LRIPSLGRFDDGFSVGQNDGGVRGGLIVVADKLLCLGCLVGRQIVSPTEADGLVEEFDRDMEGAGSTVGGEVVARGAGARGEVGIGHGFALDGNVGWCGGLVKAGGEDAIVLEVLRGGEQAGGDVALAVAKDGLEDLDLIGLGDAGVVRREPRGVDVVCVAGDGAVGVALAGLEDDVAVTTTWSQARREG
jgi:hypothetical protein